MKLPSFTMQSPQPKIDSVDEGSQIGTYSSEFSDFVARNAPTDFRGKFERARPFIVTSFIAWPIFWLYRGLDWGQKRPLERLPNYIKRTFVQAKGMQIAIIAAGVVYASYETSPHLQLVNKVFKTASEA